MITFNKDEYIAEAKKSTKMLIKVFVGFLILVSIAWFWAFGHHGFGSGYIFRHLFEFDLRHYYGKEEIFNVLNERFPIGSDIKELESAMLEMGGKIHPVENIGNLSKHYFSIYHKHGELSVMKCRITVMTDIDGKIQEIKTSPGVTLI